MSVWQEAESCGSVRVPGEVFTRFGRGRARAGSGAASATRDQAQMSAVPGMAAPRRTGSEYPVLHAVHDQQQHGQKRQQQNSDKYHDVPSADTGLRVLRTTPLMGAVR